MELIEWLFHNCFVQLGDKCYRQIHGIPMGFSCSPVMCNLYLAFFEYSWTLKQLEISNSSVDRLSLSILTDIWMTYLV